MTEFNKIDANWKLIKNHCRTTVNKEFTEKEPTEEFKLKLLISEHTPIRLIQIDWSWKMKYWVSTEWSRHKFEKFITSQRNDRQSNYDRNAARQDVLVKFDGVANMQNLIDAWRKRLCYCATKEAREYALDFKKELTKTNPEISLMLVPNCVYRSGCPEFKSCNFYNRFITWCKENNRESALTDIKDRYMAYDEFINLSTQND